MRYDAFISYSHAADDLLAPRLQDVLQHFGKPWYRRRELSVFRDRTGLSANPGLWSSIVEALDDSAWFILLASPEAAASPWVNREVEHWIEARGTANVLVVLTEGTWLWDGPTGRFDPRSTAVPPALVTAFVEEPYHLDLTWAHAETQVDPRDGRFRDAVATLAAAIRGVPKDELVGVDVREHRRTLRTAWAAAVLLFALTVFSGGAAVAAVRNADQVQDEQAATEDARAEADRQAALARAAAEEARANADEARANADRAEANADEAAAQRADAEASAAEADANASEAEANAAAAEANAAEAEANAGTAQRNQALADASATEAQDAEARALESAAAAEAQRILAVRNAAEAQAAEEEAAANAANAEQQRLLAVAANASLSAANTELAEQQAALEEVNGALTSANEALGESNTALGERNAALEAARLTALATQARDRGNLDLAMLLAAEAHRADPSSQVARDELANVAADARHLERYLPGDVLTREAPLVGGSTVVASYGRNDLETSLLAVWDLDDPGAQPLRIDTRTTGGRDIPLEDAFLMDDGRRLVASVTQQDYRRSVVLWDLETGTELFRSAPEYRYDPAIRPPTGDVFVVQEGTQVVAVDAITGARRATWTGVPAARFVHTDCLGPQVETTTLALLPAGECTWSPDGHRLLAWSEAEAAWVMWSLDDPSSVVVVGRPPAGTSAPPRFLPGEGGRVAVALEPGSVAVVDGAGTRLATYPVGAVGGVSAIGTATDRIAVADATGGVWSIDTASGVVSARRDVSGMCSAVTSVRYSEARTFVVVMSAPGCAQGAQFAYVPAVGGDPDIRPDGVVPVAFLDGDTTRAELVDGLLEISDTMLLLPYAYDVRDCRRHAPTDAFVCSDGVVVRKGVTWQDTELVLADAFWVTAGTDPDRLVATMPSGRLALFDLSRPPVGVVAPFTDVRGSDAVMAPDGTRAVVVDGSTLTIVDRATGASRSVGGLDPSRATPEFSPDSGRLLVSGTGETTMVIDPADGAVVGVLDGQAEVSPDGSVIATLVPGAAEITLVSASDLSPIRTVPIPGLAPRSGAVGPRGEWIALIDDRDDFVVIDTETGARLADLPGRFPSISSLSEGMTVSPDGTRLLVTSAGSGIEASLWDTSRWVELAAERRVANPLCVASVEMLTGVRFSPEGDVVSVAGQLLSVDGLTPIGSQVGCSMTETTMYRSVAFPGDGSAVEFLLVDAFESPPRDMTLVVITLDPEALVDDLCTRVGRNLTATERNRYLGGRSGATCTRWPA